MNEYMIFLSEHWVMCGVLTALVFAYLVFEIRYSVSSSGISPEQAVEMFNHEKAVLLDIRKSDDFKNGHAVGAQHTSAELSTENLKKLKKYAKKTVICVCYRGYDAEKFAKQLKTTGFEKVLVLAGGMQAWQSAGLPLITEDK